VKVAFDFAKYVTFDVFTAMTTRSTVSWYVMSSSLEMFTVISEESGDFFSTIKDRGNTFLRNFGKLLSYYMTSHPEKKV
jgi:hypothetical protein